MDNKLIINIIKTDMDKCFISDCHAMSGYDYNYHQNKIDKFLFDGETPVPACAVNWFVISKYPEKIQRIVTGKRKNERYELKDKDMASEKFPLSILRDDKFKYDDDVVSALYSFQYDELPDELEDVDCKLKIMCEVSNFQEPPIFNYNAIRKVDFSERKYTVTNQNIKHSLIDHVILPPPLLSNSPCELSSKVMYDITRQYIKDNINSKYARITSDYDFCFEVKKIVPLLAPETMTYHNIFATTKKERDKIHFVTKETKETTIFQMTHTQENYKGYTPIQSFTAASEAKLKKKIDEFLDDLITVINKPLETCSHCNGTGYYEPTK